LEALSQTFRSNSPLLFLVFPCPQAAAFSVPSTLQPLVRRRHPDRPNNHDKARFTASLFFFIFSPFFFFFLFFFFSVFFLPIIILFSPRSAATCSACLVPRPAAKRPAFWRRRRRPTGGGRNRTRPRGRAAGWRTWPGAGGTLGEVRTVDLRIVDLRTVDLHFRYIMTY
jgi:hypothetical protein